MISIGSPIDSNMLQFSRRFKWTCQTLRVATLVDSNRKVFVRTQKSVLRRDLFLAKTRGSPILFRAKPFENDHESPYIVTGRTNVPQASGFLHRNTIRQEIDWNFICPPRDKQVHSTVFSGNASIVSSFTYYFHNWRRVLERCQLPTPLVHDFTRGIITVCERFFERRNPLNNPLIIHD